MKLIHSILGALAVQLAVSDLAFASQAPAAMRAQIGNPSDFDAAHNAMIVAIESKVIAEGVLSGTTYGEAQFISATGDMQSGTIAGAPGRRLCRIAFADAPLEPGTVQGALAFEALAQGSGVKWTATGKAGVDPASLRYPSFEIVFVPDDVFLALAASGDCRAS